MKGIILFMGKEKKKHINVTKKKIDTISLVAQFFYTCIKLLIKKNTFYGKQNHS